MKPFCCTNQPLFTTPKKKNIPTLTVTPTSKRDGFFSEERQVVLQTSLVRIQTAGVSAKPPIVRERAIFKRSKRRRLIHLYHLHAKTPENIMYINVKYLSYYHVLVCIWNWSHVQCCLTLGEPCFNLTHLLASALHSTFWRPRMSPKNHVLSRSFLDHFGITPWFGSFAKLPFWGNTWKGIFWISTFRPYNGHDAKFRIPTFEGSSFFFIFFASFGCAFAQLSPGIKILGWLLFGGGLGTLYCIFFGGTAVQRICRSGLQWLKLYLSKASGQHFQFIKDAQMCYTADSCDLPSLSSSW